MTSTSIRSEKVAVVSEVREKLAASDAAITPGCQKVSFAVEFMKNHDIVTHHLPILLTCSESSET